MREGKIREWATFYRSHGIEVLPLCSILKDPITGEVKDSHGLETEAKKLGKRPIPGLHWKSKEERDALASLSPEILFSKDCNLGVLTGHRSELVVLDFDTESAWDRFVDLIKPTMEERTWRVNTRHRPDGWRGRHLYYRTKEKWSSGPSKIIAGMDVKGEGGYVVAPPSLCATGEYEWDSPDDVEDCDPRPLSSAVAGLLVPWSELVEKIGEFAHAVIAGAEKGARAVTQSLAVEGDQSVLDMRLANALAKTGVSAEVIADEIDARRSLAGVRPATTGQIESTVSKAIQHAPIALKWPGGVAFTLNADGIMGSDGPAPVDALLSNPQKADRLKQRGEQRGIAAMIDRDGVVQPIARRAFLVADLVPESVPMLLSAQGGTGKGHLGVLLGVCVALGRGFGPFVVPRRRGVVLVSAEDEIEEVQRRVQACMAGMFPDDVERKINWLKLRGWLEVVDLTGLPAGDCRLSVELLDAVCAGVGSVQDPGLIVLDPLTKMMPEEAMDMNAQRAAADLYAYVDQIVARTRCAVLLAAHTNKMSKGASTRGATTGTMAFEDLARAIVMLDRLGEDEIGLYGPALPHAPYGYLALKMTKNNYAPLTGTRFVLGRYAGGALRWLNVESIEEARRWRMLRALAELPGHMGTFAEWKASMGGHKANHGQDKDALVRQGMVVAVDKEGKMISAAQSRETDESGKVVGSVQWLVTEDAVARLGSRVWV